MKRIKYSIWVGALLLVLACKTSQSLIEVKDYKYDEFEYTSYFTEATKEALLGDWRRAIKLYDKSIEINPSSAASYYQKSKIYFGIKDIDNSKICAKVAVKLDSNNLWYNLNLINIYSYNNEMDSIIVPMERVVKLSDNIEYKYNLAIIHSKLGNDKRALELLSGLNEELQDSREVLLLKHNIYSNLNQVDSAIYALETITEYFPEDYTNYGILAEYLAEVNRKAVAQDVYKKLLRLEPDNGLVQMSYGDFMFNDEKMDSAFVYYKKAIASDDISIEEKLNLIYRLLAVSIHDQKVDLKVRSMIELFKDSYEDSRIYLLSAEYYINKEMYDDALEDIDAALHTTKDNYMLWEQSILIENYNENYEAVVSKCDSAIKYFEDQERPYLLKSYALYFLKNYESTISVVNRAQGKFAETDHKITYLNMLADSYRELGNYEQSNMYYDSILVIEPMNLMIRNNYGYYLAVRGERLEYAEELSRVTIKIDPKNATYLDTYAWILFKLGRNKEAKKYIELAIRNGGHENAEVLDHYGDIMLTLNFCEEAEEAWNRALHIDSTYTKIQDKLMELEKDCND